MYRAWVDTGRAAFPLLSGSCRWFHPPQIPRSWSESVAFPTQYCRRQKRWMATTHLQWDEMCPQNRRTDERITNLARYQTLGQFNLAIYTCFVLRCLSNRCFKKSSQDHDGFITMTRTERLLELLQILRAQRYPITASTLSERLGISVRSLYRDIKTLQHQGVCIEGDRKSVV